MGSDHYNFVMIEASEFYRDFLALGRRWKREHDRSATSELALNLHGALVKIDNRFYKRQTEPRAMGAARGLSAIETVEYARQMFRLNAAAVVFDRDFGAAIAPGDRNRNSAAIRRETKRVFDQITDRTTTEERTAIDFPFAGAFDLNPPILRGRMIEGDDLFRSDASVERLAFDLF